MTISVIAIGDELLIGQVTDTNSGTLARIMAPYGWEVDNVQVVGDGADEITRAINTAFARTDVVITTGGLGPTKDDITKQVLCSYFGGTLVEDPEVLANVRAIFCRKGRPLNRLTEAQALVPTSCRVIQNLAGTAPIMWFERDGKVLVSMPGVPYETERMFTEAVFPQLRQRFDADICVEHAVLLVTDITESALAELLEPWESALPSWLHLAYLPTPGLIRLRIDGRHPDAPFIAAEVARAKAELIEILGERVLTDEDITPAELLLREAQAHGLMIGTAESCTGGNIAHTLTLIPGSSAAVAGGVVSYANEVKSGVLGVDPALIDTLGAVSEPVAAQMALGALNTLGCHIAMATSGIAGPGGATPDKPVGTVCIAVACRLPDAPAPGLYVETAHFTGTRPRIISAATQRAIILSIRELRKL